MGINVTPSERMGCPTMVLASTISRTFPMASCMISPSGFFLFVCSIVSSFPQIPAGYAALAACAGRFFAPSVSCFSKAR